MYAVIYITAALAAICFLLYYSSLLKHGLVLWTGIVSFMILYHFGLRIFFGEQTKKLRIDYTHPWYKERGFEKHLYRLLLVKKWKRKVLTFEPDNYDLKKVSLEELATNMAKSELDHWINELISVLSLLFALLWGQTAVFAVSAVLAMLCDAQFIVVQRYNRPTVLRLINRKRSKE